jgi:hypothetical protein
MVTTHTRIDTVSHVPGVNIEHIVFCYSLSSVSGYQSSDHFNDVIVLVRYIYRCYLIYSISCTPIILTPAARHIP